MTKEMDNWHRFVWKIENFSYCWHKTKECITSPVFCMESTNWMLQLFPRGNQLTGYIACYLKTETGLHSHVTIKLTCMDFDGSFLTEWTSDTRNAIRDFYGSDTFVTRNDVFVNKRLKFLPNDTLTVCCQISKSRSELRKVLCRTRIEVRWETISDKIQNFSDIGINYYDTRSITSPSASLEKTIQWIQFSVGEGPCCDENLFIEIFFEKKKQRKFSACNVFLLDAAGIKLKCGKSDIWFDPNKTDQIWKFPLFFTKWELMAKKDLYLPNDTLSLQFECSSSMGVSKEVKESFNFVPCSADSASLSTESVEELTAFKELGSLITENILCDVNLQTSTKTFPAHKAILSARSTVFKAMFTNDLREKTTNRVDIEDLDDETVRQLLLYIYTNTVENLQWQNASQLYVAADKYSLGTLKKKCSSILKANLCPSNVCEILVLVDRHQDVNMKNSVQDYILFHDRHVIGSDAWKDLEQRNPQLTSETMCHVYRKAKGF